jgi:hypothetical protein
MNIHQRGNSYLIGRNKEANQCADFSYTLGILAIYMCLVVVTHETVCFVTGQLAEVTVICIGRFADIHCTGIHTIN